MRYIFFRRILPLVLATTTVGETLRAQDVPENGAAQARLLISKIVGSEEDLAIADREEAKKLVSMLGSDDFKTREHASHELTLKDMRYKNILKEADESPDPEIRIRVKTILAEWEREIDRRTLEPKERKGLKIVFDGLLDNRRYEDSARIGQALQAPGVIRHNITMEILKIKLESIKSHLRSRISGGADDSYDDYISLIRAAQQYPKLTDEDTKQLNICLIVFHLAGNKHEQGRALLAKTLPSLPAKENNIAEFQSKLFEDLESLRNQNPKISRLDAKVLTIKDIANAMPHSFHSPLSAGNFFMPNSIQYSSDAEWQKALQWAENHGNARATIMEHEFALYTMLIYSLKNAGYVEAAQKAATTFFERVFDVEDIPWSAKINYYLNFWDFRKSQTVFHPNIRQAVAQFTPKALEIYEKNDKDIYNLFLLAKALLSACQDDELWQQAAEKLCVLWGKKGYQGFDTRYVPHMLSLYLKLGRKNELTEIINKKKNILREPNFYAVLASNGALSLAVEYLHEEWPSLRLASPEVFSNSDISEELLSQIDLLLETEDPDFTFFAKIFFANFATTSANPQAVLASDDIIYSSTLRMDALAEKLNYHNFKDKKLRERCLELLGNKKYCHKIGRALESYFTDDNIARIKNTNCRTASRLWRGYVIFLLQSGNFDSLEHKLKLLGDQGKETEQIKPKEGSGPLDHLYGACVSEISNYLVGQYDSYNAIPQDPKVRFADRLRLKGIADILIEAVNVNPTDKDLRRQVQILHFGTTALHGKEAVIQASRIQRTALGQIDTHRPVSSMLLMNAVFAGADSEKEKLEVFNTILDVYGSTEIQDLFLNKDISPFDLLHRLKIDKEVPEQYELQIARHHYENSKESSEADRIVKYILLFSEDPGSRKKAKDIFYKYNTETSKDKEQPISVFVQVPKDAAYKQALPLSGINTVALPRQGDSPFLSETSFVMSWNLSELYFGDQWQRSIHKPYISDEADFNEWEMPESERFKNHVFGHGDKPDKIGRLDLYDFYRPAKEWQVAYLSSYIYSPEAIASTLLVASNSQLKVFLNGEEVFATGNNLRSHVPLDAYKVDVRLMEGLNQLIIKTAYQGRNEWWLRARFSDMQGIPLHAKPASD